MTPPDTPSARGQAPVSQRARDSFKQPYAEAGHDVASLFADGGGHCFECNARLIDLAEDLAYGEMRRCNDRAAQARETNPVADLLSQALRDRDEQRFRTIAFVNRHMIIAALARPAVEDVARVVRAYDPTQWEDPNARRVVEQVKRDLLSLLPAAKGSE